MNIGRPTETETILVGMHRPDYKAAMIEERFAGCYESRCPTGHLITKFGDDTRCWKLGCWDVPIYASLEELVTAGFVPKQ